MDLEVIVEKFLASQAGLAPQNYQLFDFRHSVVEVVRKLIITCDLDI